MPLQGLQLVISSLRLISAAGYLISLQLVVCHSTKRACQLPGYFWLIQYSRTCVAVVLGRGPAWVDHPCREMKGL